MKIRNGFVSNSSSSSFIVELKDCKLSTNKLDKLIKSGFFYTCANIWDVDYHRGMVNECDAESADNLAMYVVCNEDDVIQLLVDNRIPFIGLTHYGHNATVYDGKSTTVSFYANLGNKVLMYKPDDVMNYVDTDLLKAGSWQEDYSAELY